MLHLRMDMPLHLMALYGSAMIVVVYALRKWLRDRLPKFVFPLLWGLVMVRLLVPFSLSSPISAPVPDLRMPVSEGAIHTVTQGTAASPVGSREAASYSYVADLRASFNWQLALGIAAGVGALATAGVLLTQKLRYSRKLADSLLIEHNPTINAILREMGMGHVLVFSNDAIASPLVSGILRPRIYLPAAMDFRHTALLRHILVHECMHIKRKDNGLKAVMLLVLCLHVYNPLVWLMAKCLASDLEAACDAAVLKQTGAGAEERKGYAASLLAMAITGNRSTLLYSAFSKTEVERRMRNVLGYRKATSFMLTVAILVVLGSSVVFATGGQAPFSADLSSYCGSTSSKWGVRAELTRDIALGKQAGERADKAIFAVLAADTSGDPDRIADHVKVALAKEFGVEKAAFRLRVELNLSEEELAKKYAGLGLTKGSDGFYRYKGEAVRVYQDVMLGAVHTRDEGSVDLTIERDRLGTIKSVKALRKGDSEFDRRSQEIERRNAYDRTSRSTSAVTSQENDTAVQETLTEGTSRQ